MSAIYLETLQMIREAAHDLDAFQDRPAMRQEAARYQYAAARDMRILTWLAGRCGMPNLIACFGLGVCRAEIDLKSGTWTPIGDGQAEADPRAAYGFQVITMPVLLDPSDPNSIIDILAFDAEDPQRCWLREGNSDLLGEAALDWSLHAHDALTIYSSPWRWVCGYAPVLEAWQSERRSVEADCRAMTVQACLQSGNTGWGGLRWAETTLRVWLDQRMPRLTPAGMHGVCVLNHDQSYETLFRGCGALVGDSPAHARWIDQKLKEDRRRRRQAESLPEVGYVAPKTMRAAAA